MFVGWRSREDTLFVVIPIDDDAAIVVVGRELTPKKDRSFV